MRCDTHHILFCRKTYNKGCAHLLRKAFAYELPINIHQDLHATVGPVPPLDEDDARELWIKYKRLDEDLTLEEAYKWLIINSPSAEFAIAIIAQYGFLQNRGVL